MTAVAFRKGLLEARDLIEKLEPAHPAFAVLYETLDQAWELADDPLAPTAEAVARLRVVHQALLAVIDAHK